MGIYVKMFAVMLLLLFILGFNSLPMIFRSLCAITGLLIMSWLTICLLSSIIFWCFGLMFTAKIGLGIWIIFMLTIWLAVVFGEGE